MLYKINFLVDGISHANLVEASNIELAKSFFIKEHLDGDATRLVEIKENNESYKPGQPCWKVPDDWKVKVLWFSRHEMTPDQKKALGACEINQINRTIGSAYDLKEEIEQSDIVAIVAPIGLQQQFLSIAGNKPVIMAVNDRILIPTEDGEDKVSFKFVKWERIKKIEVVKEDFNL